MTPVKEVETSVSASSPAVPSALASKSANETSPRPQPVPMEIAVTVNGARTIEGSDKREPFSESTKTVLVFANGAVIRLASTVAPGQLLFVTNEKSKKEVICQVIKSRNDGKVTGYVELEFTEPALGFWGVRMPADASLVAAPASTATVLPKPPVAARPVALPTVTQSIAPQNVSRQTVVPPVAPIQVVAPTASPAIAPPKLTVVAPPPAPEPNVPIAAALPSNPLAGALPVAPLAPPQIATVPAAPVPVAAILATLPAIPSEAVKSPALAIPAAPPRTVASIAPVSPAEKEVSTEELKQHAARLQEQLNALLFREAAAEKAQQSVTAAVSAPPSKEITAISEAARKVMELVEVETSSPAAAEAIRVMPEVDTPIAAPVAMQVLPAPVAFVPIAPVAPPAMATEGKPAALSSRTSSIALQVEEVKIPSWLAPLTREAESTSAESGASVESSLSNPAAGSEAHPESIYSTDTEAGSRKSEAVMFGGQLLGATGGADSAPSGSKKGVFIAIAAAVLLMGAGVWYGMQPGNFLAAMISSWSSARNSRSSGEPASQTESAAPVATNGTSPVEIPVPAPASQPVASKTATVPAPVSNRVAANSAPLNSARTENPNPRSSAPVDQAKKPALGDVRLSAPSVNRSTPAQGADAAPAIGIGPETSSGEAPAGMSGNHSGPALPLPVGGDVKPAHLLKSTPPIYPANARSQRVAGDVKIDALIDASGVVTSMKVISGPTLLHTAAMTAVKQWKYEAAQLDGKPTPMHLTVTVQFRLQ